MRRFFFSSDNNYAREFRVYLASTALLADFANVLNPLPAQGVADIWANREIIAVSSDLFLPNALRAFPEMKECFLVQCIKTTPNNSMPCAIYTTDKKQKSFLVTFLNVKYTLIES